MDGWRLLTRPGSPWQRLAVGLLVALTLLLALEGVLRFLPLDRWEASAPGAAAPLFVPGEGELAAYYVTNPHFGKVMSRQQVLRVKPAGVRRIFVLGGSAALGWPGPVEASFAGYLQRALQQVAPGRFEIVNVAAMSYGSHRVLDFLADVVALDPDLVIVWSGNNEYVERNLLPPLARTRVLGVTQRLVRGSALYRGVRLALAATAPQLFARGDGADLTDPRQAPQVRRDVPTGRSADGDREVLHNYRDNLLRMAGLIEASGAAGIFCTVPVNLRDWLPARGSAPPLAGAALSRYDAALRLGEAGRFAEAAGIFAELSTRVPDDPLLHYLAGHSWLQAGRRREALAAFDRARDLDQRPVRALSPFAAVVREAAARPGMALADLDAAFGAASQTGIPGFDLFLDHVHPNEAGARLAARVVLETAAPLLGLEADQARLAGLIAADRWQSDNRQHQADSAFAIGLALTNNGDDVGAEQAYLRALELDPALAEPAGNLGVIYEARGDLPRARLFFERAQRAAPGPTHAFNLANVLLRLSEAARARAVVQGYGDGAVLPANALVILGDLAAAEGDQPGAVEYYRRAELAGADPGVLQARLAAASRRPAGTERPAAPAGSPFAR